MPVPETPVTRGEIFLDTIANNETSNLPTPVTREEMFLKAIADNAGSGSGGGGGGGGGVLVVHVADGVLDKTFQEIVAADLAVLKADGDDYGSTMNFSSWEIYESYYTVHTSGGESYTADSTTGYPVFDDGGGGFDAPVV